MPNGERYVTKREFDKAIAELEGRITNCSTGTGIAIAGGAAALAFLLVRLAALVLAVLVLATGPPAAQSRGAQTDDRAELGVGWAPTPRSPTGTASRHWFSILKNGRCEWLNLAGKWTGVSPDRNQQDHRGSDQKRSGHDCTAAVVVGLSLLAPTAFGQTRFEFGVGPQYGLQREPMTPGWLRAAGGGPRTPPLGCGRAEGTMAGGEDGGEVCGSRRGGSGRGRGRRRAPANQQHAAPAARGCGAWSSPCSSDTQETTPTDRPPRDLRPVGQNRDKSAVSLEPPAQQTMGSV